LLMAATFLLLGWFKASGFVRYIPYPVVGGFLAGTGFLLAKGAFSVMTGMSMRLADVPRLLEPEQLVRWLPGMSLALVLLVLLRRSRNALIMPATLVAAAVIFYVCLLVSGTSVAHALKVGWLLGPFPRGGLYRPLGPADLLMVDWVAILHQVDKIATILVLSVVALLLNAGGLEVTVRQDIDLDQELRSAGLANLLAGLGGAAVGYEALSLSVLAQRIGGRTRLSGLISAFVCGIVLLFGASVVSYIPKMVLGGTLLYLGLAFLIEWLIDAWRTLPAVDYVLVWFILAIIVAFGFLQGITAGVFIAAIFFVIAYSRVNIISNVLNGRNYHSNVDRPTAHRELLAQHGEEIYILRLQGFIFFGTIQNILQHVRARLAKQPKLCYLVIDFHRVTRLDSSAVFGITRLRQLAMTNSVWMVWTQVPSAIQQQLRAGGLVDETDESFIILPTLDHGMEWCENKQLAGQGITDITGFVELVQEQLRRELRGRGDVDRMMKYLERRTLEKGEYLIHEGDPGNEMYFVETGMLSVQLEMPDGQVMRLRTIRGGATVGEISLYLGTRRTSSVVASRATTVYGLTAEALDAMRTNDPEMAAILHEWIARLLAERLTENNRTIEALLR
ncbi:MAG: SulP family inorganic anion transporter, partial [Anaerolineae bacterium]